MSREISLNPLDEALIIKKCPDMTWKQMLPVIDAVMEVINLKLSWQEDEHEKMAESYAEIISKDLTKKSYPLTPTQFVALRQAYIDGYSQMYENL